MQGNATEGLRDGVEWRIQEKKRKEKRRTEKKRIE
jgi:hypothetical protein